MTYNTRRTDRAYAPSVARYLREYAAQYLPSAVRYNMPSAASMAGYARPPVGRKDTVVRFTPDLQLGGFWKQRASRVEFIGFTSAQGRRVLVVLELLGVRGFDVPPPE